MHDSRNSDLLSILAQDGGDDPTNALRLFVSNVSGIDLKLVQPLWLAKPMQRPQVNVDWCALGVTEVQTHGTPYHQGRKGQIQNPESGDTSQIVHQTMNVQCSFYGTNSAYLSDNARCALRVPQNAVWLESKGIYVQEIDAACRSVPDLLYGQWINRYDFSFRIGVRIKRTFGIRTIAAVGDVSLLTEKD